MGTVSAAAQALEPEVRKDCEAAVGFILESLGEDLSREGLRDTPRRVVAALAEMTSGVNDDPEAILSAQFSVPCDEMVVVSNISFASLCEHHLLPFTGYCDIGYLPGDKVVGLSKLPRLVECFGRRLQVQEQMTRQIATAIDTYLRPRGVAVVIRGEHACMSCRGVRKAGATMTTSAMLGAYRDNATSRAEFFSLARP